MATACHRDAALRNAITRNDLRCTYDGKYRPRQKGYEACTILMNVGSVAKSYSLPHRDEKGNLHSEDQLNVELRNENNTGARKVTQCKRLRTK